MKILSVVGARPQFIKAAAVSRVMALTDGLDEVLLHTGQHFDKEMSQVFFDELDIPRPNYNLAIGGGTHGQNTGRMIESIEKVLIDERPDWVMVYGDTDSTLAGALAAVKLQIPLAHVEAGLRSYNRSMPEEINRVLTDHASDALFAPTTQALKNLSTEGILNEKIHDVGDVMYDVALFYAQKAEKQSNILQSLGLGATPFILATVHRPQNVDNPQKLACIMEAFNGISQEMPVVFPVHPRTRNNLEKLDSPQQISSDFLLIPPVGYLDMVMLEKYASVIVTDSGGVQREAYFHQVPSVILRDETEWVDLVRYGWSRLASVQESIDVVTKINEALQPLPSRAKSLFGCGDSADKIVDFFIKTNHG